MPALELTTRFRGITTSRASTTKRNTAAASTGEAVGAAMANLRYITRDSALTDPTWFGDRAAKALDELDPDATPKQRRKALRDSMGEALTERAQTGGKAGRMVAMRLTISLPNGWPQEAQDAALVALGHHFAPPGSEALAVGAQHRDKPNNAHLHLLVVDGRESEAAALDRLARSGRVPQRVRRRDVNRFNADRGRPKEIRAEIAGILNAIADERGLDRVEWESFKARGIQRTPDHHRGPARDAQDRAAAEAVETGRQMFDGGAFDGIAPPRQRPAQTPQEKPEAPTRPIPQPSAPVPPAQPPKGRKVYRGGRWLTVDLDEPATPKKRRKHDDEQR